MGGSHALVITMVLIKANQSSEQGDAKLLKRGMVVLAAALWGNIADEDVRIGEHMATGTGVDWAMICNGAVLPVSSGIDCLIDNSIKFVVEAGGAGIGSNVVEKPV